MALWNFINTLIDLLPVLQTVFCIVFYNITFCPLFSAVGDILEFATHVGHYQAQHGFETSLFTLATRPASVADLYDNAEPSPLEDIRFCNRLRSDGRTGSKIFSVPFVVDNDGTKDKSPLSPQQKVGIETNKSFLYYITMG